MTPRLILGFALVVIAVGVALKVRGTAFVAPASRAVRRERPPRGASAAATSSEPQESRMATYEVLKEHGTPQTFKRGETRELDPSDAAALVEAGALKLKGEGLVEKAKSERAAPLNKAEPVPDFNKTKPRVPRE